MIFKRDPGPPRRPLPGEGSFSEQLSALGLSWLAQNLQDFLARVTKERRTPLQIVEEFVRLEASDFASRSLHSRLARAQLGRFKPMADFDWNWPTSIDRPTVESLFDLAFLRDASNVVLVGSQGLGKTMLAKNLALAAIQKGYSALYAPASKIIADIGGQESASARERRFRHYCRPALLLIDELGYLAYDNAAADILFQLVNRRYEAKPIVLTTNLRFRDWSNVFPNAASASALIDRLTHHSHVIVIKGDSYRKHEARQDRSGRADDPDDL
jgi:DNA replication protein DnaC